MHVRNETFGLLLLRELIQRSERADCCEDEPTIQGVENALIPPIVLFLFLESPNVWKTPSYYWGFVCHAALKTGERRRRLDWVLEQVFFHSMEEPHLLPRMYCFGSFGGKQREELQ